MPFKAKVFTSKLKLIAIALLAILLIVGCQNKSVRQPIDSQLADCREVQHALGEVCVPNVSQRLITLDEVTLGDALALGVSSIGVSSYDELADYLVEKNGDIEFLGKSEKPSLEKMYQLNPDLIVGTKLSAESIYPQLSKIAPTAVGEWNGLPSWREHFNFVARVLDKEEKANAVWSEYNRHLEELKTVIGNPADLEISLAFTYGNEITMDAENSFAGSILTDLGVSRPQSQARVVDGTISLPEERLSDLDADILLISIYDEADSSQVLAQWQKKPLWKQLQVVKNKQVYFVDARIWRGGDPIAANLILDDLYKYLVEKS